MRKLSNRIFILLLGLFLMSCQKEEIEITYLNLSNSELKVMESGISIEYADSVALTKAICASINSVNTGKSVGVFGGSLSCNPESLFAKYLWAHYLGMNVFTYGMGGYGFSSLQGSIQKQVDKAKIHDICILWASTNDYTNNREIGEYFDYTEADGFNKSKLTTQCGGMNYCINKLRKLNPKCIIYIFGSLPFFQHAGGYTKDSKAVNAIGHTFYDYIEAQKRVAEYNDIKFFNQFDIPILTNKTSEIFYKADKYHLTESGYANIGVFQLYFLATEEEMKCHTSGNE